MPYSNDSSQPLPPWLGFVLGLCGGFALSAGLIGLVLGYSMAGAKVGSILPSPTAAQPNVPTAPAPPAAPDAAKPVPPVTAKDHVRGDPKAKVSVIEYSDFECPFCKRHAPTMKMITDTYKTGVNTVFRHFPLSFHQNAQKEAEASECVAELGGNDAFWKFHDLLFDRTTSNGTGFALDKLGPLAKEVGVNEPAFQKCLDTGKYTQFVKDQENEGITAGVQGTPGNFIVNNSTKETKDISGAVPFDTFKTTIDQMLGK